MNNSVEASKKIFDQQYHSFGHKAQRMYPNESLLQFLGAHYFHLSHDKREKVKILEVGCGSGANLWMMAKEGVQVHGLDSSAKGLEVAQMQLSEKWGVAATLKQGFFLQLPYPKSFFDAVVDIVSLQHLGLADSRVALGEIKKVLPPSGKFFSYRLSDHSVMFTQSDSSERSDAATLANISNAALPLANNGPISFWSPSLAYQMYGDAGFEIDHISRSARTYSNGAYVEYLAIEATAA